MGHEDAIRDAAYAKWEAEGRPDGQHDRHWSEAEKEVGSVSTGVAQTWPGDHHGGVSPPTSTGSVEDEQVQEPSNDWPAAADPSDTSDPAPSPAEPFEQREGGHRALENRDTD